MRMTAQCTAHIAAWYEHLEAVYRKQHHEASKELRSAWYSAMHEASCRAQDYKFGLTEGPALVSMRQFLRAAMEDVT